MRFKNTKNGFAVFGVLLFVLFIAGAAFFYLNYQKTNSRGDLKSLITNVNKTGVSPTPTNFPFQELTIPYLRSRNYDSRLGELKKFSENSSYTAYTTSFDSDGLKINGYLTIPKSEKPDKGYPAIVFIHGYIPPSIYKTTKNYVNYVDPLASAGYVVFKIDLRGHDQSEGDASGAYYSGDYIIDSLNAYSALQNSDFVNKNKIGLWGHSMGGNVVFRSFVAGKNIPVAVIWAGAGYTYSDLLEYRINDNSYRPPVDNTERQKKRQLLRDTYGEFNPNDSFWKQVPATNYLDGVTGAIELNHALDDTVVSPKYSENLKTILDNSKIPNTLKTYQSGGHNITGSSYNTAWQNTISFFDKYLK